LFLWLLVLLCGSGVASAQDLAFEIDSITDTAVKAADRPQRLSISENSVPHTSFTKASDSLHASPDEGYEKLRTFRRPEFQIEKKMSVRHFPEPPQNTSDEKFHWKPALVQSGIFIAIQHGFRITQEKTSSRLGGPFFKDWGNSVKNIRGWKDGDGIFTNYVAHPLQGSLTGRIFVNNSDNAKKQKFGRSKDYWISRLKAFAWSTAWSVQFEIGPVSEASIGNVGSFKKEKYWTGAYVDLVITPTVGTGVLIGEDAIDKYVLTNWLERKTGGKATTKIKLLRSLLTPTTTFANILRWRVPWKRDDRLN